MTADHAAKLASLIRNDTFRMEVLKAVHASDLPDYLIAAGICAEYCVGITYTALRRQRRQTLTLFILIKQRQNHRMMKSLLVLLRRYLT